ncbi:MAG: hypothetical protein ACI4VQ_05865 [Clostridia bacterium]
MDTDVVLKELEKIEKFKNINISYNESKNIYDVYARIKGDEDNTKDILNNIENLDYTYCDFGIFEFWFSPEYEKEVLKSLQENF